MSMPRYCVVFGVKDVADRYFPLGEFYLRAVDLEGAKSLFKKLSKPTEGNYVFRLSERYYDKHTQVDINYQKSEYTIETDQAGFHDLLDQLVKLQEKILEDN